MNRQGRTYWEPNTLAAMVWAKQIMASHGLTEAPPERLWHQSLAEPEGLLAALTAHRLLPAASAMLIGAEARHLDCPEDLRNRLAIARRSARLTAMRQTATSQKLSEVLEAAGVRALFIKGVFQAEQSTGDFTSRGAGDIDVLVAEQDFDKALSVLESGGAQVDRPRHDRLGARLRRVHHAASAQFQGSHIDLHHRLDSMPHLMGASFNDLHERREVIHPGGVALPTLDPLDACVYVASHGSQDNWAQLRSVVDFVLAASAISDDWPTLFDRAAALGVRARLGVAIEVARYLVPEWPSQSRRERKMADWAWSRHKSGRMTRGSGHPRDAMGTFAYWIASEGDARSLAYAVERLLWLPSAMATTNLPDKLWWLYPLAAPAKVGGRLAARARSGRAPDSSEY